MFPSTKAQASMELLFFVGFSFFIFILILGIIASNFQQGSLEREQTALEQVSLIIREEVYLAGSVQDGYERTFLLPQKILNKDYTTEILQNTTLVVSNNRAKTITTLLPVDGTLQKGKNIIRKNNGEITLN